MSTLWSGRFDTATDASIFDFNASFRFDRRLFEDDVQDAVLQFDLEAFGIRQGHQGTSGAFERLVALHAELLLGQGGHGSIKHSSPIRRLTRAGGSRMPEWTFSSTAEAAVAMMLAAALVAAMLV